MTIQQSPTPLNLLGNMLHLVVSSDADVTMILSLGNEQLVAHTYSPDSTGMIDVDLCDIVGAHLSFLLRDSQVPYIQNGIIRHFSGTLTCGGQTEQFGFTVIRAGVDHMADTPANFLAQNFLTWQPTVKPVTYYTPEFLTYYAAQPCLVKCTAYTYNGSGTPLEIGSLTAGNCYTIPTGYAVIAALANFLPSYYDVWIENQGGTRLTYVQRYYASDIKSEEEEWILFENSLGGIDTFRAYGDSENTASHEHHVAEIEEESVEYRVDTERKHKKSTGLLDKYERRWLLDFFPSKGKYIYAGQSIRRIVVTDSDVSYNAKELPSEYNFTYKLAEAKPYLNLPRTDVTLQEMHIDVPDIGSFTIAPRLVEFPRQTLSEGALFPIQNPYSESWGVTTLGAIAEYLTDNLAFTNHFVQTTEVMLDEYLPLCAGINNALTDNLYARGILPVAANTYALGSQTSFWKDLFIKRIYFRKPNANNDENAIYLEYDGDSDNPGIHLVGAGFHSDSFISALGRGSNGGDGSALLFDPLASINEANLGIPQEAGVGIVWNGLAWVYGRAGGFSSISKVSEGVLRWSDGITNADVDFTHSHAFADITGKPTTLAGYGITDAYTMAQTDALLAAKVDVSWFRNIFRAYASSGSEILPNASGTIDNIQAMLGFWTNQYFSALGRGSTGNSMLDASLMWSLLGSSGNQQIDPSHLADALGTYIPQGVLVSVAKNTEGKIDFIGSGSGNVYTVNFLHSHAFADITGKPTTLAGYGITDTYTMAQTDALLAAKVDVSWFRNIFRAYASSGSEILPNASGTIDNIQAMLGFWTNQYISALGRGSSGSTLLDEAMMWSILGNSDTSKQISLSHLTTALSSYAQTANVITGVVKNSTDGKIDFVSQSMTHTVDFNHTHSYSQITGQPTKLSQFTNDVPYATTAEVTSSLSQLSYLSTVSRVSDGVIRWGGQNAQADVDFIHTHAFADITGKPTTLAGYGITDAYTMAQTDALLAAKVDVSWFRNLFRAYASNGGEILPNASGTIDNIQAMLGFWTNQYISALGRGSSGSTLLDETMMWSLLGNSDTTKQISLSHLTTALSSYAQTASVISGVQKNSADGKIDFISQSQTITVDFIHTHSWSQITGQPTKLSQFTNDLSFATTTQVSSAVSTAIAALSFYNGASWNASQMKLTLSGQNASTAVTLTHSHDTYLGTTKLTTGNASGSVTAITGLASINTNALKLTSLTYNSATVNAVGIGNTPSYPFDVQLLARFSSGVKLTGSGNTILDIINSQMMFSGTGITTQYIRKGTSYLALSSSSSGENGLVVYNTNEVRFSAGAWSDSYLSALGQNTSSDQRLKTELGPVELSVDDIAAAPMVRYLWTHNPSMGEQAGSYAQYWQPILPETVKTGHDGYLEMQYGVIALLSAIATARRVKDHERRILKLEAENR